MSEQQGTADQLAECTICFALVRPEKLRAHEYWHEKLADNFGYTGAV